MTAGEAIHRVDELEPNQFSDAQKLRWLSNHDGQIYEELVKTHADHYQEWQNTYLLHSFYLLFICIFRKKT